MGWRCAGDQGCGAPLDGGDHGPFLASVTAHLRAVHGGRPVDEAFQLFRHERTSTQRPTAEFRHDPVVHLDIAAARGERDEAMERVEDAASEEWKMAARATVRSLAESRPEFFSDDVWAAGLAKPAEPRALGPIMMWAQKEGLVEATDRLVQSAQVASHGMPRRVWRSLVQCTAASA